MKFLLIVFVIQIQLLFNYVISYCSEDFIKALKFNMKHYFVIYGPNFLSAQNHNEYKIKCFELSENFRDYVQTIEDKYGSCDSVPEIVNEERKALKILELYCSFDDEFRKCII